MKKPVLIVMAAGMGSRYGGLKQLDPVGPHGELIIDYSIFDARRAGFETVIFVIKREIEDSFKAAIGDRLSRVMDVRYAFQELTDLPAGYAVPEGRAKPWGTCHAVLAARRLDKLRELFGMNPIQEQKDRNFMNNLCEYLVKTCRQ